MIHTPTVSCHDEDWAALAKFVPLLRLKKEIDATWRGITASEFATIATDHCTYTVEDNSRGGQV